MRATGPDASIAELIEKDRIRELGLLYSRAIDRKDNAPLRTLHTDDATDSHGDTLDGPANACRDFIARSAPDMRHSGHHLCNHLIAPGDDGRADGEIHAIACHVVPDRDGGWVEDVRWVRDLDNYRKGDDGRWRFARRAVTYDFRTTRPVTDVPPDTGDGGGDPSHAVLAHAPFARGARA